MLDGNRRRGGEAEQGEGCLGAGVAFGVHFMKEVSFEQRTQGGELESRTWGKSAPGQAGRATSAGTVSTTHGVTYIYMN